MTLPLVVVNVKRSMFAIGFGVNHSSKAKKIITNSWSTWIKLCQFKGNMDPMLGSPHMSLRPDFGAFRNITASMRFDNSVSPILSEIHFAF